MADPKTQEEALQVALAAIRDLPPSAWGIEADVGQHASPATSWYWNVRWMQEVGSAPPRGFDSRPGAERRLIAAVLVANRLAGPTDDEAIVGDAEGDK